MKFNTILSFLLILLISSHSSFAQEVDDVASETNFFIPSAPAFTMLGVTPEVVTRPGYIRDFKVDWRIKNYNLAPDLALEAQPVWFLYYDRHDLDRYRRSTPLQKTLSTMSLSFATAKIDNINHMSSAIKFNIYREKDPIMDKKLIAELQREVDWDEFEIMQQMNRLRDSLDFESDPDHKADLRERLVDLRSELKSIRKGQKDKLKTIQEEYVAENWNASMFDVAIGRVWTYNNGGLDSLKTQGAGFAFWMNGSIRMGEKGQILGLLRYKKSGFDSMISLGCAYRYGSQRYNFYTELIYETLPDYNNAVLSDEEIFAGNVSFDLGSGWLHYDESEMRTYWTMSYGGDFMLNKNILLNFALRTKFTSGFKFTQLLPVANITCLMR